MTVRFQVLSRQNIEVFHSCRKLYWTVLFRDLDIIEKPAGTFIECRLSQALGILFCLNWCKNQPSEIMPFFAERQNLVGKWLPREQVGNLSWTVTPVCLCTSPLPQPLELSLEVGQPGICKHSLKCKALGVDVDLRSFWKNLHILQVSMLLKTRKTPCRPPFPLVVLGSCTFLGPKHYFNFF